MYTIASKFVVRVLTLRKNINIKTKMFGLQAPLSVLVFLENVSLEHPLDCISQESHSVCATLRCCGPGVDPASVWTRQLRDSHSRRQGQKESWEGDAESYKCPWDFLRPCCPAGSPQGTGGMYVWLILKAHSHMAHLHVIWCIWLSVSYKYLWRIVTWLC